MRLTRVDSRKSSWNQLPGAWPSLLGSPPLPQRRARSPSMAASGVKGWEELKAEAFQLGLLEADLGSRRRGVREIDRGAVVERDSLDAGAPLVLEELIAGDPVDPGSSGPLVPQLR